MVYNLRKRKVPPVEETTQKKIKVKAPKEEVPEKKAKPEAPSKEEKLHKKTKDEDNQYVFGSDTCGELGLRKLGCTAKTPIQVRIGERIEQVACGAMHTISLTESGKVYSYGCNDEGALGRETDGDETLEATPTVVDLKNKVTKITSGDSHCAALTDKNQVFIWGNFRDEHGSVGLLPECEGQLTCKPIQVLPEKKIKDIASGSNHMLLLDVDGIVYSFGVGAQGQLGRYEPTGSGEKSKEDIAITAENRDLFLRPQEVSFANVDKGKPFCCDAIYAGNFSSFATNSDKKKNRLAGWGLNNYYQLGYKGLKGQLIQYYPKRSTFTCATSMINVACGQHHTIFLTKTGRVYAAGRNDYGMLGINSMRGKKEVSPAQQVEGFDNPVKTISAGINTSFAVSQNGKLYSWGMSGLNLGVGSGENDLTEPTVVEALSDKNVSLVSAGSSITAVIVS